MLSFCLLRADREREVLGQRQAGGHPAPGNRSSSHGWVRSASLNPVVKPSCTLTASVDQDSDCQARSSGLRWQSGRAWVLQALIAQLWWLCSSAFCCLCADITRDLSILLQAQQRHFHHCEDLMTPPNDTGEMPVYCQREACGRSPPYKPLVLGLWPAHAASSLSSSCLPAQGLPSPALRIIYPQTLNSHAWMRSAATSAGRQSHLQQGPAHAQCLLHPPDASPVRLHSQLIYLSACQLPQHPDFKSKPVASAGCHGTRNVP